MTKDYELPKGRRMTADFDENGIIKVTVQALDSLIGELNYYADKVCDIEQIRAEIDSYCSDNRDRNDGLYIAMKIIDKYKAEMEISDADSD